MRLYQHSKKFISSSSHVEYCRNLGQRHDHKRYFTHSKTIHHRITHFSWKKIYNLDDFTENRWMLQDIYLIIYWLVVSINQAGEIFMRTTNFAKHFNIINVIVSCAARYINQSDSKYKYTKKKTISMMYNYDLLITFCSVKNSFKCLLNMKFSLESVSIIELNVLLL